MAYRPYPVRERALRQILRRHRNELPPSLLPPTRTQLSNVVGEYRLSTRPGVSSGIR
ncbi:hypothetical protein ACWIGB_04135 [Streptomyces albidoflavus]|uniref:hypothetical protein n=1 Tax=Streptomyces sp. HP-A2021 TaxID=2927875 RepID=UPI001FB0197D|nr:hypothetical protein [Streptomyces sp. HP-A2021]UOB11790.1 hypothetical protein MQE23_23140 [Streptomyces sp. HP-A2021]